MCIPMHGGFPRHSVLWQATIAICISRVSCGQGTLNHHTSLSPPHNIHTVHACRQSDICPYAHHVLHPHPLQLNVEAVRNEQRAALDRVHEAVQSALAEGLAKGDSSGSGSGSGDNSSSDTEAAAEPEGGDGSPSGTGAKRKAAAVAAEDKGKAAAAAAPAKRQRKSANMLDMLEGSDESDEDGSHEDDE